MIIKIYAQFNNKTIAISIIIFIILLYILYTFNACLLSGVHRTFSVSEKCNLLKYRLFKSKGMRPFQSPLNRNVHDDSSASNAPESPEIEMFGSIVRVVPLIDSFANESDGSRKYRLIGQQGDQLNRQLPDVLIIGVKKSGTRALLEFIRLHPDVRAAGSEIHFFDRHYGRGLHWYRNHMPPTIEGQITMEKTPSYFITREVPQRVHHMNPGTK